MFLRKITVYIVGISVFLPLYLTEAVEPLTTIELASHCSHYTKKPKSVDAFFCIRYIQGFIDGAIATDKKVAENAVTKLDKKETFSERAIRTRIARSKNYSPTYYAEFCLGTPVPLKSVVDKIITNFNNRKYNSNDTTARDAVYYILRKEYPCEKLTNLNEKK